jgi:phosphoribosylaminoimidazole-succinocarboxamide synthase
MLTADRFVRSGKVRDLYALDDERLLLVASDRISAFDVVLPSMIPDKGRVLTGLSRFWFAETSVIVPNHFLDSRIDVLADAYRASIERAGVETPSLAPLLDGVEGRIMICRPAEVVPIEAVVRGYLAGSGWKEYQAKGTVCGIELPTGLRESDRLPEPIFTPATKAEQGEHDENITFDEMIDHLATSWALTPAAVTAAPVAEAIRDHALRLYRYASAVVERSGIVLADTKFEFGWPTFSDDWRPEPPDWPAEERTEPARRRPIGNWPTPPEGPARLETQLMLIDEALTPDSSRFWDAASYEPGRPQASFDKQFVRDWLETQPWDKTVPGPELPEDVIEGTRKRYIEAYERITGASFERYLQEDVIAS